MNETRGHIPSVGEFVRETPDGPLKIVVNMRGATRSPDGRLLSKLKFRELYEVLGDKFGSTDAEFRLPDLRPHIGNTATFCPCGMKIEVMAFRGTGVCSVKCKKKFKGDVSSVGTYMFVTTEEKQMLEDNRA